MGERRSKDIRLGYSVDPPDSVRTLQCVSTASWMQDS